MAAVLATSYEAGRDALEHIEVDYEPLDAVVDLEDALSDRVLVHPDLGTNTSYVWKLEIGEDAVEAAFASAAHIVKERYVQQRLIPMAMEPRAVAAVPQPFGGDLTLYSATQIPHVLRVMLAVTLGVSESQLRVVAPSVGGGFGSKLDVYAEELLCAALARKHRAPVRWVEERTENAQATIHGRGQIQDIELAADEDGKLLAVRVNLLADMGGYLQLVTPGIPLLGAFLYGGVYDLPLAYSFTCTGVFTTLTPTDAYRGAGRPEATYAIERAMDALATKLGARPRRAAAAQLHPQGAVPVHRHDRAGLRLGRPRQGHDPGHGAGRLRRAAGRAGRAPGVGRPPSTSASGCRRTSRCAAWRRRGCWPRSTTRPAGGSRPRSGCCPPTRSRSSPAPRPTARATRPRGR